MRDRSKSRNYSPARDEFRRDHEIRRKWGLMYRHAEKLRRLDDRAREQQLPPALRGDRQDYSKDLARFRPSDPAHAEADRPVSVPQSQDPLPTSSCAEVRACAGVPACAEVPACAGVPACAEVLACAGVPVRAGVPVSVGARPARIGPPARTPRSAGGGQPGRPRHDQLVFAADQDAIFGSGPNCGELKADPPACTEEGDTHKPADGGYAVDRTRPRHEPSANPHGSGNPSTARRLPDTPRAPAARETGLLNKPSGRPSHRLHPALSEHTEHDHALERPSDWTADAVPGHPASPLGITSLTSRDVADVPLLRGTRPGPAAPVSDHEKGAPW